MTTKDKGITLPAISPYQTFASNGIVTTSLSGDYTPANAWLYGNGFIQPWNAAPLQATTPITFTINGQNGTASFAANGGSIVLKPGIGSGGNASGVVQILDQSGTAGWNTAHIQLGIYHLWNDANGTLRFKSTAPTGDQDGIPVGFNLQASGAYDPPSLVDGAGTTTTIAVAGAALGDFAVASFSLDTQGILVTTWVSAANIVSVRFQNETTGTIDLAAGTLRVKVIKQ